MQYPTKEAKVKFENNFFCKITFSMAHKIIENVVIFITSKQNNYRCRLRGIDNYIVCKIMYT